MTYDQERLVYAALMFLECSRGAYHIAKEQVDQHKTTEGRVTAMLFTETFDELTAALEAFDESETEP